MKSMMIENRERDRVKAIDMNHVNERETPNQRRLKRDQQELDELLKEHGEEPEVETTENVEENAEELHETATEDPTTEGNQSESEEEKTWAKRYGDLRRHAAETERKLKAELEELKKGTQVQKPLATEADVKKWLKDNPKVGSIMKAIVTAEIGSVATQLEELKKEKQELTLQKAKEQIKRAHPDFDTLEESDEFHAWAEAQPKWIQEALYENPDDPQGVIAVLDLYKAKTSKKSSRSEPLVSTKGGRGGPSSDTGKRIWRESEIMALSNKDFEKYEADIDKAMAEGRYENDVKRRYT